MAYDNDCVLSLLNNSLFIIEFDINKLYIPNDNWLIVSTIQIHIIILINLIVADLQSLVRKGFKPNKPQWIIHVNLY